MISLTQTIHVIHMSCKFLFFVLSFCFNLAFSKIYSLAFYSFLLFLNLTLVRKFILNIFTLLFFLIDLFIYYELHFIIYYLLFYLLIVIIFKIKFLYIHEE